MILQKRINKEVATMDMDFKRRNILVLGGSDGIGFAVARQLVKNGASVCIVGRNEEKLKTAYEEINKLSGDSTKNICISSDLTQVESAINIKQVLINKWGGQVDSLVLNAGGPPMIKNSLDVPLSDWHTYFQSLFLSQITLVGAFIDFMKMIKFGRIVSISSSSIIEPIQGIVISSAIRSALAAWLKTIGTEVAHYGINVSNAVIGKIDTQRIQSLDKKRAEDNVMSVADIIKDSQKNIPAGRYGTPEEAANVIVFLLSKYASYINGSSVFIDGGSIRKCF